MPLLAPEFIMHQPGVKNGNFSIQQVP